jgi:mannose/fructose-specific phosphotransferase system component IIA
MKNYICLMISHGDFAFELNAVAQKFIPLDIPVYLYSNKKDSIEKIVLDVEQKIKKHHPEQIIVFVDLVGGSCWHAAMAIKKNHNNVSLFGGMNLPAVVSLATNINRLAWPDLLTKVEGDAVKAIKVIK